jgi:membrane-bound serine protease (ClpP class)
MVYFSIVCLLLLSFPALSNSAVREVSVTGLIHPVTTEIISGAIRRAIESHDALLIIRIDTPGGLLEAMRECVSVIESSPVPVVTYVSPRGARAASAGFFILEAGDVAAMSSGTNTGAAHPVILGAQMDPVMKDKLENDAAAALRSMAAQRGRNVALAESAVRQSKSFTEREALDGHLIEIVARDETDLLRQLDGRSIKRFDGAITILHVAGASIAHYQLTLRQRVVSAVSDPNIALILFALGVLGIYLEFIAPGLIFPGVIGALCAILGLAALSVLPLNWLGVTLVLLSLAMFALELKFVSHGILTAGAAVALVLGATMLIDSPIPEMRIHLGTALAVAIPLALITAVLLTLVVRARRNKVITGAEGMIGEMAVALEDLTPGGRVLVHGENWQAQASSVVARGARVRITGITNLLLRVEPVTIDEVSKR